MPSDKFRMVANSMFTSRLVYCISVWGAVWHLPGYDDRDRAYTSISKEDMGRLQTMQNSVLRLQTGLCWNTPTTELVRRAGQLSVHQLAAYHSLLQTYKCKTTGQPKYMFTRLFPDSVDNGGSQLRGITNENINIHFDLSLSRGSFFYRAGRLWNWLPISIKNCGTVPTFKKHVKKWIFENISVTP